MPRRMPYLMTVAMASAAPESGQRVLNYMTRYGLYDGVAFRLRRQYQARGCRRKWVRGIVVGTQPPSPQPPAQVLLLLEDGSTVACDQHRMQQLLEHGEMVSLRFLGRATQGRRAVSVVCSIHNFHHYL